MSRPEETDIVFDDDVDEDTYESHPFPLVKWWRSLEATEQTLYGGLAALSAGLAGIYWPWGLIAPGAILTGLAVLTVAVVTLRRP